MRHAHNIIILETVHTYSLCVFEIEKKQIVVPESALLDSFHGRPHANRCDVYAFKHTRGDRGQCVAYVYAVRR